MSLSKREFENIICDEQMSEEQYHHEMALLNEYMDEQSQIDDMTLDDLPF